MALVGLVSLPWALGHHLTRAAEVAPAATASGEEVRPSPFAAPASRYHTLVEVQALLDGWVEADPARVERVGLPASRGGIEPPAIAFGAAAAGSLPLAERATVVLLGGLDGRSLAGGEAVLRAAHALLASLETLRSDLAFVVVPWASPDGLARASAGERHDGRDAGAVDDDEDGFDAEDAPDDLDGDGQVLELLLEDPLGPFAFSADRRFLVPAADGDAPRLVVRPEGRDDDGDGRWNEDGVGGTQLDATFPAGWQGPQRDGAAGRFPLDEPLALGLAELVRSRRTALVLVFQGNHGGVAIPGGTLAAELSAARDLGAFEALAAAFSRATGRPSVGARSLRAAHGGERPGAALDWFHGALGVLVAEVAVWGPDAVGRDGRAVDRRLPPAARTRAGAPPSDEQRRWARWLDDVRGGLEFADWRPVELGLGRRAWVGGWRRRADLDPPADALESALAGVAPFVREVVDGLPRLDLEVARLERMGDLVRVRARLVNRGTFPTGLDVDLAAVVGLPEGRVTLEFEAPCAGALLAGEAHHDLGVLQGGGAGPEHEWLVVAPPGTRLAIHARAGVTGSIRRELRP